MQQTCGPAYGDLANLVTAGHPIVTRSALETVAVATKQQRGSFGEGQVRDNKLDDAGVSALAVGYCELNRQDLEPLVAAAGIEDERVALAQLLEDRAVPDSAPVHEVLLAVLALNKPEALIRDHP